MKKSKTSLKKTSFQRSCIYNLMLTAGLVVVGVTTAQAQGIPNILNEDATYINESSGGDVAATRTVSPSDFTVTFGGNSATINGSLLIGTISSGGSGGIGGVTLNFGATTSAIKGNMLYTNDTNVNSNIRLTAGTLTIDGNVADGAVDRNFFVFVSSNTELMIKGNLGSHAIIRNASLTYPYNLISSATVGVQGNISPSSPFGIDGGTLKVGSTTTGMNKVTMMSTAGSSMITSYSAGDLAFSNGNRPIMNVGANSFTIQSNDGDVSFSGYAFGAPLTGFSTTGGGSLTVATTGAGKNLNFNDGVNLNTTAYDNPVTLSSANGDINFKGDAIFNFASPGSVTLNTSSGSTIFEENVTLSNEGAEVNITGPAVFTSGKALNITTNGFNNGKVIASGPVTVTGLLNVCVASNNVPADPNAEWLILQGASPLSLASYQLDASCSPPLDTELQIKNNNQLVLKKKPKAPGAAAIPVANHPLTLLALALLMGFGVFFRRNKI